MKDTLLDLVPKLTALLSISMMGLCALFLFARLARIIRGEETTDARPRSASPDPLPVRAMLLAAALAILSRLLIYAAAHAMYRLSGGTGRFFSMLEPLWTHWDTRHYVAIARDGYVSTGDERLRLVFFPLYPLLMRLLSPLTGGNLFFSGLLLSLLCSGGAAALLYDLSAMHTDAQTARLAVLCLLLSPMSVFLCCAYTEALFLLLTLLALVLLRRGHPWLAALAGAASAFTRMPGVIVAGVFLIAGLGEAFTPGLAAPVTPRAVLSALSAHRRALARAALQALIVFSGLFLYWGVNWLVTGAPLTYMTYQAENWFQKPGTFWGSVANTTYYLIEQFGEKDWFFSWGFQFVCMLGIFALLLEQRLLPFDLAAYSFVYVAVVLSPTWLLSAPRYLFALAPLPLLKARLTGQRAVHVVGLALSGALLLLFTYGYTLSVAVL